MRASLPWELIRRAVTEYSSIAKPPKASRPNASLGSAVPCPVQIEWSLVGGLSCEFLIAEPCIDLNQRAVRVHEPELVQRRALPGRARRLLDVGTDVSSAVERVDHSRPVCHLDAKMIKRVVVELTAVGND